MTQAAASRPAIEEPAIFAKPTGPGWRWVSTVAVMVFIVAPMRPAHEREGR